MKIVNIDHINIIGPQSLIDEVSDFYTNVLGLVKGKRPAFSRSGYWLYASESPIVHLTVDSIETENIENRHLNHIAYRTEGLSEYIQRLDSFAIKYHKTILNELNQTQLFFSDPAGNGIELNFQDEVEIEQ